MTEAALGGGKTRFVEWGVAARALPGEQESGDRCIVLDHPGAVLIAVIDGLGHGPEAAAAAMVAIEAIEERPSVSPQAVLEHCHHRLKRTRGAALSIAVIDAPGSLAWVGVGNVEGRLFRVDRRERESILLRGGIVGYQLPSPRVTRHDVTSGDVLIFATDGIQPAFADNLSLPASPQRVADEILAGYFRGTDDALVLVARLVGSEA